MTARRYVLVFRALNVLNVLTRAPASSRSRWSTLACGVTVWVIALDLAHAVHRPTLSSAGVSGVPPAGLRRAHTGLAAHVPIARRSGSLSANLVRRVAGSAHPHCQAAVAR